MSRILIKNGTIVSIDRQTGDLRGDLLVGNERIAAISPAIEASDTETMPPHRTTAKANEKISIS